MSVAWRLTAIVLLAGIAGWLVLHLTETPPLVDEGIHSQQIGLFVDGELRQHEGLTTLPGYHAVVAVVAKGLGTDALTVLRAISTLLGLLSVLVFYRLARALEREGPGERALHYLFQPLLLPFVFLVYTDVFSLLLLLLCVHLTHSRRHLLAGLAGIASVLVRQTNIVWLVFAVAWDVARRTEGRLTAATIRGALVRHAPLLAAVPLFLVFVITNEGVAMGDRGKHPMGIYGGNPWFFFIAVLVAFAPLHVANLARVGQLVRSPKVIAALAAGFGLYWLTFTTPHPYNHVPGHLRNGLLMAVEDAPALRAALYLAIAYGALSLACIRLRGRGSWVIYPFALLALLPAPLVEQRYMLFPIVWIVLMRERRDDRLERVSFVYEIALSAIALRGFARDSFFY